MISRWNAFGSIREVVDTVNELESVGGLRDQVLPEHKIPRVFCCPYKGKDGDYVGKTFQRGSIE